MALAQNLVVALSSSVKIFGYICAGAQSLRCVLVGAMSDFPETWIECRPMPSAPDGLAHPLDSRSRTSKVCPTGTGVLIADPGSLRMGSGRPAMMVIR